MNKITVSDVAEYLGCSYIGTNHVLTQVNSIGNFQDSTLSFINTKRYTFNDKKKGLVIVANNYESSEHAECSFIYSNNPRLDFIKVLRAFFSDRKISKISDTAILGNNCHIDKSVFIGDYTVIKDNVHIGANTVINNHVVIEANTVIGENCYIKSGAIIGEDGFGFEKDNNGIPLRFPHVGNVEIGNNVEIGANSVIARATLDSTIIKDNGKIDDQVFIAHNCIVEENVQIVACTVISGSVYVGRNTWIGPNTSIKDKIRIGRDCFIGVSSNISKNLKNGEKIGNISNLSLKEIVRIQKMVR